jgi:transcription antitermination factor NusG
MKTKTRKWPFNQLDMKEKMKRTAYTFKVGDTVRVKSGYHKDKIARIEAMVEFYKALISFGGSSSRYWDSLTNLELVK